MATTGLGVTIGGTSLRGVLLKKKGEGFLVQRVFADRLAEEAVPVAGRALAAKGLKGVPATVGLTGRDVIIRYTQIPPVPDWRLRTLMKFEVDEVSSQSGGDVSADYRRLVLPDPEGTRDDDTVLVALARNRYIERAIQSLAAGGIKFGEGTPQSVALFNAFAVNATYREDETALLVNIGGENVDLALQQGGELLFARNATPGGKAFTQAIEQAFSTTFPKAEKMKIAKADVTPKGQARYADPTSEKVANAIMGVAGQLGSIIQSTLMIARAQLRMPELKVHRVVLAGGGSSLQGLDLYLKQVVGVPVERFNPFELCDLSALPAEERAMAEAAPHEFSVVVGLAQAALSPAAFRIGILPEKLRKARDFATKGIWAAAAGLVAVGSLFFIHQGRAKSVAAIDVEKARIKRQREETVRDDERTRVALADAQQAETKHRILADMAEPGAFLLRVLEQLETRATEHIYLESVRLQLDRRSNAFPYFVPKASPGSGYEQSSRTYGELRDPFVVVEGRVSGGENPSRIAGDFQDALRANKAGLVVETKSAFKPGAAGRPGTFTLEIRPGIVLEAVGEGSVRRTLRDVRIDTESDPPVLIGRRSDGVLERVPQAEISKTQWTDIVGSQKDLAPGTGG